MMISISSYLICICSCSLSNSPEEIVLGYKDALNTHNVDSLLSFYSIDIVFSIPDLKMYLSGKDALRGVAEYDSVLNTIMTLSNVTVSNDTVFCSIRETNDWMNISGISSAFYPKSMFVVRENKIRYIEADMADSSLNNFAKILNSFFPWAKETYPNALDSLMPGGEFQFSSESASLYRELLKKWRDTSNQ